MDFPKGCGTNVLAVPGYAAISYQAFSVKQDDAAASTRNIQHSELLQTVEALLRERKHHVVADIVKRVVWVFTTIDFTQDLGDQFGPPHIDGCIFIPVARGTLRASELSQRTMRSTAHNAQSPTASSTPLSANMRATQAANVRAVQQNAQVTASAPSRPAQSQPDILMVYRIFMSAVIGSIFYHLARSKHVIPLNSRTFVAFRPVETRLASDDTEAGERSVWLIDIDLHFATTGTLLIAANATRHPHVLSLWKFNLLRDTSQDQNCVLRIAPNGVIVRLVGQEILQDMNDVDADGEQRRKRLKRVASQDNVQAWKSAVQVWLERRGVHLANLEREGAWVKIRLPDQLRPRLASSATTNGVTIREFFWPTALCLCYISEAPPNKDCNLLSHATSDDMSDYAIVRCTEWFKTEEQRGFRDPFQFPQDWLLRKPERDKTIDTLRQAQKAEEEAAVSQTDSAVTYPSSPLYSRGMYSDMQAASVVYPTPPDGIYIPGSGGTAFADGPNAASNNNDAHIEHGVEDLERNEGENDIKQESVNGHVDELHQSSYVPQGSDGMDFDAAFNDGNDDLFEDIDEDIYAGTGNDITEADFSFFDDPGAAGLDMSDADISGEESHSGFHVEGLEGSLALAESLQAVEIPPQDTKTEVLEDQLAYDQIDPSAANRDIGDITEQHQADAATENPPGRLSGSPVQADASVSESKPANTTDSPLTPLKVRKRLLGSPMAADIEEAADVQAISLSQRRSSKFNKIAFSSSLESVDAKYGGGGRFQFLSRNIRQRGYDTSDDPSTQHRTSATKETCIDLPPKPSKANSRMNNKDMRLAFPTALSSPDESDPVSSLEETDTSEDDTTSTTSSVLVSHTKDDDNFVSKWHPSRATTTVKRKLEVEDDSMGPTNESTGISVGDFHIDDGSPDEEIPELTDIVNCLNLFEPDSADWSLSEYPTPVDMSDARSESRLGAPRLSDKDFIFVAQMVSDQVVASSLDMLQEEKQPFDPPSLADLSIDDSTSTPDVDVHNIIKRLFPNALDCDLAKYASIQDVAPEVDSQSKGQPKPVQRRSSPGGLQSGAPAGVSAHLICPMPVPHVRVRKNEALWDLLPTALSFWEPLGLEPASGPKNVMTYCVYPFSEDLEALVNNFLESLGSAYESCRLGTHTRGDKVGDFENGLVPVKLSKVPTPDIAAEAFVDCCQELGKALALSEVDMSNVDSFVVYVVNPFNTPQSVTQLCMAFWTLFQRYSQTCTPPMPDVVLQLVPMKYVASFHIPVVLEPNTITALAREVYNRCPPSASNEVSSALRIYAAPSIQLEEALPRSIQFKLVADPPSDLLHEFSYLHIGYTRSFDSDWIAAAWTDNSGKQQATVSYCLRGGRSFVEVAQEIWQTTVEIMQGRRVTWRACIARTGVMDREEMEAWISLASGPSQLPISTTLVSIDPSPPLKLIPPTPPPTQPHPASAPETPQPGVSPEANGPTPAATPPDPGPDLSKDPDTHLIDLTDETWGVVLSHRLNNSNSLTDYRPALASGMLIKRGSDSNQVSATFPPDDIQGPICVGVNVLWVCNTGRVPGVGPDGSVYRLGSVLGAQGGTETAPRTSADAVLRELLVMYRGLGLLARVRGMRGTKGGTLPWHIAAAVRGVRGLEVCLGRGEG